MKVLSIIDSNDLYGKERANFNVDHLLKTNGYEVVVLINSNANERVEKEASVFRYFKIQFPRNIEGTHRLFRYIKAFFVTTKQVRNILSKEKPDFIFIPTEIALSYLYFALVDTSAEVVFRCGDSPLVFRKVGVTRNVYSFLWKNGISKRIDRLICNAKFLQRQIIKSGYEPKKQDSIIYNYPPKRAVYTDNVKYVESKDFLRVGFMGRIVPDKGVMEMCQAVTLLNKKRTRLLVNIAGDTLLDPEYTKSIYSFIEKHKELSEIIHFLGNVNDIKKFYDNIDVICIPSIYEEPMANVVTEAKMHNCPCIIFNQGGMPEIVEHKKTGYICPEVSVDALAEGIKYYLDNPNLIIEHGENAFRSIEELGLTKEIYTKKWLQVFSDK